MTRVVLFFSFGHHVCMKPLFTLPEGPVWVWDTS